MRPWVTNTAQQTDTSDIFGNHICPGLPGPRMKGNVSRAPSQRIVDVGIEAAEAGTELLQHV